MKWTQFNVGSCRRNYMNADRIFNLLEYTIKHSINQHWKLSNHIDSAIHIYVYRTQFKLSVCNFKMAYWIICCQQLCWSKLHSDNFLTFYLDAIMEIACSGENKDRTRKKTCMEKLSWECRLKSHRPTGANKKNTRQTGETAMMNKSTANNGTGMKARKQTTIWIMALG